MTYEVLLGDCIESMKKLPAESVDMCVTSPPYYSLRDYGNDKQIGLEATLGGYIDNMVKVFEEVRRILKPEGTLWLNLGDSYNGSGGAGGDYNKGGLKEGQPKYPGKNEPTLKRKDLMGVPWRVAFALQEAGWWLRQDIIWAKPNCMPEPVKDRCTRSHEYIFMLTKQEKYYYDNQAIKEPVGAAMLRYVEKGPEYVPALKDNPATRSDSKEHPNRMFNSEQSLENMKQGRNKRSVWTISPKPYKGAHFAVYPPELIEPCILAGCPHGGTVLDPFGGSGTTAGVAVKHGRNAILCELNEEYAAIIPSRVESITQIPKEVLNDKREWI